MTFLPSELIRKKRFGGEHTSQELKFLIQGFAQEQIPDYQMAAWLMAICFKGMSSRETAWLTQEMRDSGVVLDLSRFGVSVDKHSTGGVGDKTSMILAPLVASFGIPVPMMAGRGLGHTGGTLDKLESIPGFSVQMDFAQFKSQLEKIGCAIIGQTKEICPADRKLYALRDVTGTVDSLPLICGSIMSKKLAEGMSALVLDVKYGSGAFMKNVNEAENLARALSEIGVHSGKKVRALITRMDEPLGRFIGNSLEIYECLEILRGKTGAGEGKDFSDTIELTIELAAHMIVLGGKTQELDQARNMASCALEDGSALRKFEELCKSQGGDLAEDLPRASNHEDVLAQTSGFMKFNDIEKLGLAGIQIGAGRRFQTDKIDHSAGIEVFCRQGQAITTGQTLFRLYFNDSQKLDAAKAELSSSYEVSSTPVAPSPLIAKVLL